MQNPLEPKSPLFPNSKQNSRSPAFSKFCADELPPLSPLVTRGLGPRFLSKTTPSKLPNSSQSILSEEVLDIETLMEKTTRENTNSRDLFEKILNENDPLSPFLKKKPGEVPMNTHFSAGNAEKFYRPSNPNNSIRLGSINRFEFRKTLNPLATPVKPGGGLPGKEQTLTKSEPSKRLPEGEKPGNGKEKAAEKPENTGKGFSIGKSEEKLEVSVKPIEGLKLEEGAVASQNNNAVGQAHVSPAKPIKTPNSSISNGCKCKKSRCLKLYCECFAAQGFCKETCNCLDCANRESDENVKERERAIQALLVKNPAAFHPLAENLLFQVKKEEKAVKKGCNCKKSHCLKRYCECFEAKLKCDAMCKCEDCKNVEEDVRRVVGHKKKGLEEGEKPAKKKKV